MAYAGYNIACHNEGLDGPTSRLTHTSSLNKTGLRGTHLGLARSLIQLALDGIRPGKATKNVSVQ
jgi:hypothetical protein